MVKITGRIKKYGNSYYLGIPKAFIDQDLLPERELITCEITVKAKDNKDKEKNEPADFRMTPFDRKMSLFKNITTNLQKSNIPLISG